MGFSNSFACSEGFAKKALKGPTTHWVKIFDDVGAQARQVHMYRSLDGPILADWSKGGCEALRSLILYGFTLNILFCSRSPFPRPLLVSLLLPCRRRSPLCVVCVCAPGGVGGWGLS